MVKDVMINIFDYPHIPYWFSIAQAMRIIKVSFLNLKKYLEPIAILVFDEKYNFLGTVTPKDILKGLEPEIFERNLKAQVAEEPGIDSSIIWDSLFNKEAKDLAVKPVSEIMIPAKIFIEPDASVKMAAYMMLRHDLRLLPVLENKKKLIGVVRMIEIFDTITDEILKE
jgi:CBS-domain-containing membrane protein